ncbi:MAG: GGDEF domain-containing protein [Negativicutes bacterium]|nr:GGDEF domain-containing protein [Negativicutes bacterium]
MKNPDLITAVAGCSTGIMCVHYPGWQVTFANKCMRRILGLPDGEFPAVIGDCLRYCKIYGHGNLELVPGLLPSAPDKLLALCQSPHELQIVSSHGQINHYHLSASPVSDHGSDLTGFILIFTNIDSYKSLESDLTDTGELLLQASIRLHRQSITDSLTGVHNRMHILNSLRREIERVRRYPSALSILMIDIDHFKTINDRFGHPTGDSVLKSISQCLASTLRTVDMIGRYGGEEFLIILPSTDLPGAAIVAERLCRLVSDCHILADHQVTVSIGCAELSPDDDIESLITRADRELYRAKASGRNCVAAGNNWACQHSS